MSVNRAAITSLVNLLPKQINTWKFYNPLRKRIKFKSTLVKNKAFLHLVLYYCPSPSRAHRQIKHRVSKYGIGASTMQSIKSRFL